MSTHAIEGFASPTGAGQWTKGLLLASLALAVVATVAGLLQIDLLSRATSGNVTVAEAAASDARQQTIGVLQLLVHVATAVAFLVWFRRVHKNLSSIGGRDLKYTSGWAIGGFFVPFLNLIRPLQVMREVWHGSDPAGIERDTAPSGPLIRDQLGTPSPVGWWWALFVISSFLANVSMRMLLSDDQTIERLQAATFLDVVANVLWVSAAVLAILVVGRVTAWQVLRADEIYQSGIVRAEGT